jgi:hypothetical protein
MVRRQGFQMQWGWLNVDATTLPFAALYPLQRLKAHFPPAKVSSGHRLFISAFMPTSKIICDDTYSSKSWCIVGQGTFALREINRMEHETRSYLEWQLNVDATTLPFAALYPLRLKARFLAAKGSSGYRLFISAFMPTSQIICDDTYSSKSWCVVGQGIFSLREINQMEREMCFYLERQLNVDLTTLRDFRTRVQQPDRTRDVLLPGMAAQHLSLDVARLSTRIQQPDGTRDVLLPGVAAQRRSPNFATLELASSVQQPDRTRDVLLPGAAASTSSTSVPRRCATFKLASSMSSPHLGLIHP